MNYYNENNREAAAWLRELITAGEIPDGLVDTRSITDVRPHELSAYAQQHFFAGIGGWPLALRLAGWPESRPVRTGSCPCQPFSQTGKRLGTKDERHLWPVFRDLITFGEATVTFGEQVASPLGRDWLAGIRADLEGLGYEVGAADLCAAGIGAPHIRQRLYWMAYARCVRNERRGKSAETFRKAGKTEDEAQQRQRRRDDVGDCGSFGGLANSNGRQSGDRGIQCSGEHRQQPEDSGIVGGLEHAARNGRKQRGSESGGRGVASGCGPGGVGNTTRPQKERQRSFSVELHGSSAWSTFEIVQCHDGKARRFEPGSFPLAHGISGRVGLLRGYGNAIVPQLAAEFIQAAIEVISDNNERSGSSPLPWLVRGERSK